MVQPSLGDMALMHGVATGIGGYKPLPIQWENNQTKNCYFLYSEDYSNCYGKSVQKLQIQHSSVICVLFSPISPLIPMKINGTASNAISS